MPSGTHWKGPLRVSSAQSAGFVEDIPADAIARLRDAYVVLDFAHDSISYATGGGTDTAVSNATLQRWRYSQMTAPAATNDVGNSPRGWQIECDTATQGQNVIMNHPSARQFDTEAGKPITLVWQASCDNWDGLDLFLGMTSKAAGAAANIPMDVNGALDTSNQNVGYHQTGGTDSVPQMVAVGDGGSEVVATPYNGGIPTLVDDQTYWFGLRIFSPTRVGYYFGSSFDQIKQVGQADLATSNDLNGNGMSPAFSVGYGGATATLVLYKMLCHKMNDHD